MEKNVWIRCLHCGKEYTTLREDWKKTAITYNCTECNKDIEVSYFGACSNCLKKVGFYPETFKNDLINIGLVCAEVCIRPTSGLRFIKRILDDVPSSNHMGFCPYCHRQFIKCPHCGVSNEVKPNTGINDIIICLHCNGKMRLP